MKESSQNVIQIVNSSLEMIISWKNLIIFKMKSIMMIQTKKEEVMELITEKEQRNRLIIEND